MRDYSGEELAGALWALGVPFLAGATEPPREVIPPQTLLAALARQREARLRLAIIPLLLVCPELASALSEAINGLDEPARSHLQIYYSAARNLQSLFRDELAQHMGKQPSLPALFDDELGLEGERPPDDALAWLGAAHKALTGQPLNWTGSYRHAAARLIKRLETERPWQQTRL